MDETWVMMFKAYLEIGILGLCGVLVITIAFLYFKKNLKREETLDKKIDKKDDNLESKYDKLLNVMIDQNQKNQELLQCQLDDLRDKVINGITNHTLSSDENNELARRDKEVNDCLKRMRDKTGATRAALVRFHNGGKDMNGLSFLKMSMTNEIVQLGQPGIMNEFQNVFRSFFSHWIECLMLDGYCYIDDTENLSKIDTTMHEYFISRGIQSVYGVPVSLADGTVIGFIYLEFADMKKVNKAQIESCLHDKKIKIETLYNYKRDN